jgi:hypothetical protein
LASDQKEDPRRGLPGLRRRSCRWVSPDGGSDGWELNDDGESCVVRPAGCCPGRLRATRLCGTFAGLAEVQESERPGGEAGGQGSSGDQLAGCFTDY